MKIVTIVGARPQFVKAAVLSRVFKQREGIEEVLVHTGQHYDANMSDVFFDEMEIPRPKYNLSIHGLDHGAMTGQMLEKIEEVLKIENPDWVLVYGDTNSTIAGALAARKKHIKVAHVEAGLRSFNMKMPEEINRILTDRISNILFAPTTTAVDNLNKEGFENLDAKIVMSGDVMQDASMYYAQTSAEKASLDSSFFQGKFVLGTIHRAENTDDLKRLRNIVDALNEIHKEMRVVLPIHPRTKQIIATNGMQLNVDIIDPVGYFDMIELLKNCELVLTDSGGLQKEAFFFEKNCVTLRDETEWVELINNDFNVLAGANQEKIISCFHSMLKKNNDFSINLYGGGTAGQRIVDELVAHKS